LITRIDKPVVQRLKSEHPDWVPEKGACPECVYQAANKNRLWHNHTSIQEELIMPYPVYSPHKAHLIPTPQRVGASPQYSGQGVTLAFLDSGFYPHPDLTRPENRILCYADATGAEIVENEDFNLPHITSWHGLMTSCLAAGNGFKSRGFYRGIAYRANLVFVKTGHQGGRGINENDIQRALKWVIANRKRFNIRVVNISLGGDHPCGSRLCELDRLVEDAVDQGLVVITAAGNDGTERLVPPASAPSGITVGGLDDRNSFERRLCRMYHSNYGLGANSQPKPEVIAPAMWLAAPMLPRTEVHNRGRLLWQLDRAFNWMVRNLTADHSLSLSTRDDRYPQLERMRRQIRTRMVEQKYIHPHYQHVDGTSMAAPVVSSVVAQLLEANPALTPAQVKEILMSTADPLAGIPKKQQGAGVINAARAVAVARRVSGGPLNGLPISPHVQAGCISLTYYDPACRAARVALVGAFNHWDPKGYDLQPLSTGLWQISIQSPPAGSYRYKFLVDDRWEVDIENPDRVEDGYGGFSSVLKVHA
jgi:serine protease AprX